MIKFRTVIVDCTRRELGVSLASRLILSVIPDTAADSRLLAGDVLLKVGGSIMPNNHRQAVKIIRDKTAKGDRTRELVRGVPLRCVSMALRWATDGPAEPRHAPIGQTQAEVLQQSRAAICLMVGDRILECDGEMIEDAKICDDKIRLGFDQKGYAKLTIEVFKEDAARRAHRKDVMEFMKHEKREAMRAAKIPTAADADSMKKTEFEVVQGSRPALTGIHQTPRQKRVFWDHPTNRTILQNQCQLHQEPIQSPDLHSQLFPDREYTQIEDKNILKAGDYLLANVRLYGSHYLWKECHVLSRNRKGWKLGFPDRRNALDEKWEPLAADGAGTLQNACKCPLFILLPAKQASNSQDKVRTWCRTTVTLGVDAIRRQYNEEVRRYITAGMSSSECAKHPTKNRYKDVPCQDQHRVRLAEPAPCSYIHANYVEGSAANNRRYICTQGPLDITSADFWHMVIQEKTDIIVMLTNIKESGLDKCAQYWPEKERTQMQLENITITNSESFDLFPKSTQRIVGSKLRLDYNFGKAESRKITHYQWKDWPDRSVPKEIDVTIVDLFTQLHTKAPIVIHCSPGVGRSGIAILLDQFIGCLDSNISFPDVKDLCQRLRDHRAYMLQNEKQYLYIHRVLLHHFYSKYIEPHDEEEREDYGRFVRKYEKAMANY
ncbi:unnamed protein product, partial [Mesorhabditis spiculigera]